MLQIKLLSARCVKVLFEAMNNKINKFAIYEYIGRMIEFAIGVGAVQYHEDFL